MRDLTAPQTTAFSSNFRKVSARLRTRAEKLVWTRDALDEQIASVNATFSNVSTVYSASLNKFVRYGIKTGTSRSTPVLLLRLRPMRLLPGRATQFSRLAGQTRTTPQFPAMETPCCALTRARFTAEAGRAGC